ncbi:helix-turn-helix domain-containing protein [Haliangium sp.]|uniref:helix-turn-helix domain-containing protein n=1 Tax=Haliangium sp. TaxID=2663208 RepID=UPI003D1058E2
MSEDLLTTKEAARILGVGTTSIKRWADSGVLRCVKTPGGHRRFPRTSVEALIGRENLLVPASSGRVSDWISLLVDAKASIALVEALLAERRERGSWVEVVDALGPVIEELGRGWARGEISVVQEHIASERLARGLARCGEMLPVPPQARTCLLMTAEHDDHTLGLAMCELCLREARWRTTWVGHRTPLHFACEFIDGGEVDMVAVSASEKSRDPKALEDQAGRLGEACRRRGIPLILGGNGRWPEEPRYGRRLRSFVAFAGVLDELSAHAGGGAVTPRPG